MMQPLFWVSDTIEKQVQLEFAKAMPLSLSDDELTALLDAARPIPRGDRDQFLREVASELEKFEEIGVAPQISYVL